jgi:hypothetical protein
MYTKTWMWLLQATRKLGAKFIHPGSYGIVTDLNITFGERVFRISDVKLEAVVDPDGILEDCRRELLALAELSSQAAATGPLKWFRIVMQLFKPNKFFWKNNGI